MIRSERSPNSLAPAETARRERRRPCPCPHLGLADDDRTAFAFPVAANHCYRVDPPVPVKLHYQSTYCLNEQHTACPIYRQQQRVSLPPNGRRNGGGHFSPAAVRARLPSLPSPVALATRARSLPWPAGLGTRVKARALPLLALAMALLILLLFWYNRTEMARTLAGPPAGAREQALPAAAPSGIMPGAIVTPTATATASPTPWPPTPLPPTATLAKTTTPFRALATAGAAVEDGRPTATATQSFPPGPAATTAAASTTTRCGPPAGWVLYRVQPGDTLFRLSLRAGTALSRLQQANCLGRSVRIYTGQALYVPSTLSPPSPTAAPAETATATSPPRSTATSPAPPPTAAPPTPPPLPPTATPVPPTATSPPPTATAPPTATLLPSPTPALLTPEPSPPAG